MAITVHLKKMGNDEHLRQAFKFFDQNQSGYIEIDELRGALADEVDGSNEEVINAIINDVDTDKVSPIFLSVGLFLDLKMACIFFFLMEIDTSAHTHAYFPCFIYPLYNGCKHRYKVLFF